MKYSNITTPRTLAECSWVTGYSRASIEQTGRFWERVILVLAVSFVVAVCLKGF